ncbi:MAG: Eco57I restriction-modification methylase domain-containing protein [Ktedonobacteraceae bacterium]
MPELPQASPAGPREAAHRNQRLFSDHYLNRILPKEDGWQRLLAEAAPVMEALRKLYSTYAPGSNEAQTERDWIRPVLEALGHTFEVQATLQVPGGIQRPDYIFYANEAQRIANKDHVIDENVAHHGAIAIGDAKQWGRSLDQVVKGGNRSGDAFNNKNPSYQIFFYMLHSKLPWGILTNGQQWRLYHEQSAHRLEVFYEVDLPALLIDNKVERFLYFYAFFRRRAFEPGPLALGSILEASAESAQKIRDDLSQQVYDALRYVAQGFLDFTANGLKPTPETRKEIYENSLILLYRLLFILYAEARNLLPIQENERYKRRYSLQAIKHEVISELVDPMLIPTSGDYWQRLKTLFGSIDKGNEWLGVTTFNGGLFDPQTLPFLERYIVGDLGLCWAISKLTRANLQFIDYRDLSERHLGTIYESLLEYTLHVATEPMVELRASSKIVPAQGVPRKDVAARYKVGEVYFTTDTGERKLTGSYYTPDFIVKYMVEQTLQPVLDAAVRGLESDAARIEAVLAVNVLDPAMGSGHFPVEVVEYIARYLVELGVQPQGRTEAETDMTYWKRRVVQQCIYGVDLNPLSVELAKLSLWLSTAAKGYPLNFLDHHLRPGNALLGSWLAEVAAGQHPAELLAQKRAQQALEAMQAEEGTVAQLSMLEEDEEFRRSIGSALDTISAIEHSSGSTIAEVKQQEADYEELRARFIEKYRYLLDLGAALFYDVEVSSDVWRSLAEYALGKAHALVPAQEERYQAWREQASVLGTAKRLFHWELEFPDVFYDHNGRSLGEKAGFDVVIGNPPYVRQEKLGADKPFFQEHFEVYHGVADLFVYFFAQGLRLLRTGGRLAYISSNTWMRANYATPLRRHLRLHTTIESIIDLGNTRVFADAPDLSPSIQIVHKTEPIDGNKAQVAIFSRGERIPEFKDQLAERLFPLSIHDQPDSGWQLKSDASRLLFSKIMQVGKPLGEVVNKQMYRGILTGLNEAFIIDSATRERLLKADPGCADLIKPVLRGEDLRPWYQENEGRWLISLPSGWSARVFPGVEPMEQPVWEKFARRYPALAAHLEPFAEAARKRQDKGQFWWELRPCAYYDVFEQPKIFYPDITRKVRFSWGEPGVYIGNTGYCIPTDSYTLLGMLASRTLWFTLTHISQPLGERAGTLIYRLFRQFMERLPIPTLTNEQHARIGALAQQITRIAKQRYKVRRKTTHRIQSDLGTVLGKQDKINQRLALWWDLSFDQFKEEARKSFKRPIPLRERGDWEELLREQRAEIEQLTGEIMRLETELNEIVYDAFGLDEDERRLIERETKYKYGEW